MMRRIAASALTMYLGVGLALALREAFIRVAGSTDLDGQFTFMGSAI